MSSALAKHTVEALRREFALDLAHERGLQGTVTTLVQIPSKENGNVAIVHCQATFMRESRTLAFAGLGTCGPANANSQTANYPVEMAETRAIVRALRQGINVGNLQFAEITGDAPEEAEEDTTEAYGMLVGLRNKTDLELGEFKRVPDRVTFEAH